jgi:hypothetical protein
MGLTCSFVGTLFKHHLEYGRKRRVKTGVRSEDSEGIAGKTEVYDRDRQGRNAVKGEGRAHNRQGRKGGPWQTRKDGEGRKALNAVCLRIFM